MLDISVTNGLSGPVLSLAGEADVTTLAQLNSALDTQIHTGARLLTVDLSRLRFADSATVAALIAAARSMRGQGGRLEVLHPRPAVARILQLTGADQILHRPALPRLRVQLGGTGRDAVLRLAGEIDLTTISIMAAAVDKSLRDHPARMTIDMRAVTFCDCAGMRTLLDAQQQATAARTGFRLTGLTPPVRRILTLMRATGLLRAAAEPASSAQEH
jgi:anti-anti-sigma factor